MSDTNPNDVERALAAFGATPIKYRSFGKHHLQTAAAQMPLPAVVDDTVYDPFGPQPVVHSLDESRPATFQPASVQPRVEPAPEVALSPGEPPPYLPTPPVVVREEAFVPEAHFRPSPSIQTATVEIAPPPAREIVDISAGSLAVPSPATPEPVAVVATPAVIEASPDETVAFLPPAELRSPPVQNYLTAATGDPMATRPRPAAASTSESRPATPPPGVSPSGLPSLGMRMTRLETAPQEFVGSGPTEHRSLADMFTVLHGRAAPIRRVATNATAASENSLFRRL